MIRKLIQLSPSTAVVSLPSSWIKRNKLQKGAALFVEENENKIVISTDSAKSDKEIALDISSLKGRLMWVAIDAAYVAGYDSITLTTKDQEQSRFMTKVVRYFPGMIIYEERKNKVHFKDMTNNSKEDLDKIISRIFNLNVALLEDAIEAIKTKDWELLADIKRRDYSINSYISYCLRQLNKFGYTPLSKLGLMHGYIKVLEMLSDKFCTLFVGVGKEEINLEKELTIISGLLELYKSVQRIHFKFTQERLIEIEEKRLKLLEEIPKTHVHVKLYLVEILELFFDLEELEMQLHT